ncbi:SH3 domain-binding glutamic acid-rich-like protein 3 [Tachysurus vachellii]|uniref:SH3 domain-binding glutamic acid-rich-like protein 3 n=1 Tax=Tachysurus vachellii TaxID=175792 RepID=UPI00296AD642|nr:SH3 domain-binding glutamic acid-rich-like protein 3 [Tachysurus vachellii]
MQDTLTHTTQTYTDTPDTAFRSSHYTMPIIIYMSSASGSREIKKQQEAIFRFLDSKNIHYIAKDITVSPDVKNEMREKVGNFNALPPQVFNGSQYCGDYEVFSDAVEDRRPMSFFKLNCN